jgi:autotransporter-associated beta strand protein
VSALPRLVSSASGDLPHMPISQINRVSNSPQYPAEKPNTSFQGHRSSHQSIMKPKFAKSSSATLGLMFLVTLPASAVDRVRNTTSTGLINGTAWTGGTTPGSSDRAVWNSTSSGGAQTLGGNTSWGGILISSGTPSTVQFTNTANPTASTLTLGGDGIDLNNGSATSRGITFESNTNIALGANQTWKLGIGGTGANIVVSSVISGSSSLGVTRGTTASNYLQLGGANTFSGGLILGTNSRVLLGTTSVVSGSTITNGPTGTGTISIGDGSTISSTSSSGRDVASTGITVNGNFVIGEATTYTGRIRFNGALDLGNATRTVTITNGTATGTSSNAKFGFATIAGSTIGNSISNGTLSIQSSATGGNLSFVHFANQVDFVGNSGLILGNNVVTCIGTSSAFGNNANDKIPNLTIQSGGVLDMSDQGIGVRSFSIASLSGAGSITSNATVSGTSTLTINGTNAGAANNTDFSGSISNGANVALALTKTGSTTQALSGASSYSGGTVVSGGTLLVNNTTGSATGSGTVNVSTGAAIGGAGIISGATTVSGSVRPGNSIGTLTVGNDITWNGGNAWNFELGTASIDLAAANIGGTRDLLDLTGAGSDFLKGTGSSWTFDFANSGAVGWYKIVDWTGTTSFSAGDFTATNLASGLTGSFTVDSGTSALYLNVVPEPGAALLGGLGLLALLRRRR